MTAIRWQTTLKDDATAEDTLHAILATVRVYCKSEFAKRAVDILKAYSAEHNEPFLQCLFHWACRNIDYKLDPAGNEIIRTPDATVRYKNADCKKFSVLLGSLLCAAGYEPIFKHVYYAGDKNYSHIYVLLANNPGADFTQRNNYTVLDCTNGCSYDQEVNYATSTLYFLNGTTMPGNKLTMMGAQDNLPMAWGKDIGNCAGNLVDGFKSIGVVDPNAQKREAVLMLLQNNIHGIANAFAAKLKDNPDQASKQWIELGGHPADLKAAVLKGISVKAMPLPGAQSIGYGGVPPTPYAAVGAAPAKPTTFSNGNAIPTTYGPVAPQTSQWQPLKGGPFIIPQRPDGSYENDQTNCFVYNAALYCQQNGQDYYGYYGWVDNNGQGKFWSDPTSDKELRQVYNDLTSGHNFTPPLPMPLAQGQDKHQPGAHSGKSGLQVVAGIAQGPLNTLGASIGVPGLGNIVSGAANAMSGGTTSPPTPPPGFPANTPGSSLAQPGMKSGNIAGTIGGFFFKGILISAVVPHSIAIVLCVGVPLITIGLITRKYILKWKKL